MAEGRPRPRQAVRLFAVAVALTVAAAGCSSSGSSTAAQNTFHFQSETPRGQVIPPARRVAAAPLTGTLLGGGSWSLPTNRHQVEVINFWASWCAPCVSESPMLDSVYRHYRSEGISFVGVDVKDDKQSAASFVHAKHISYPIVYDETAKVALQLGIPAGGLPVTVLVDRQGRVAAVYLGAMTRNDLVPVLTKLAATS